MQVVMMFYFVLVFGVSSICSMPSEWQSRVQSLDAFYAPNDTDPLNDSNGYPGIYLPMIGNGYLSQEKGVRSNTMYISGIFNNETTSPSHRARIPAAFDVLVVNSTTTGVLSDIAQGIYHRQGTLDGTNSSYELRWYAHRTIRYIYVLEVEIRVGDSDVDATLKFNVSESVSVDFNWEPINNDYQPVCEVKCGNTTIPETPTGDTHYVCMASAPLPPSITVAKADSGKVQTFITAFRTSLDVDSSASVSAAAVEVFTNSISLAEAGELYPLHVQGWSDLWTSGIEVQGRPDVAIAINASLYAILSSVRDDWSYGLAPGGLTNYYNGHSFWDTETWMYPPLLFLHPNISLSLLQYRYDRLDGARQKALSYSPPYNGTMFPWESAFSGVETCPTFAATGLREVHISGDISFAVWQEWMAHENIQWLRDTGYPILIGVADFWISRSTNFTDDSTGISYAHIDGVIPPDEYVDHVNDSVYTNYVAAKSLQYAVEAAVLLNISCIRCETYTRLAQDLVILFDDVLGIHPEYFNYSGEVVKQADVVLLHYPLGMNMTRQVQLADCEYYAVRTDADGPAMTWGMFAINYLDLQNFTSAARYFNMSFQDNLHEPLQVWTETPGGNAVNFITGAGGFLQTLIMGYPGLRLQSAGALQMSPVCPEGVTSLKIRAFQFLDSVYDFEYWCDAASDVQMYPYKVSLTLLHSSATATSTSSSSSSVMQVYNGDTAAVTVLQVGEPFVYYVEVMKNPGDKPSTFVLSRYTGAPDTGSDGNNDDNNLSDGMIVGIAVGGFVGVVAIAALIWFFVFKPAAGAGGASDGLMKSIV